MIPFCGLPVAFQVVQVHLLFAEENFYTHFPAVFAAQLLFFAFQVPSQPPNKNQYNTISFY